MFPCASQRKPLIAATIAATLLLSAPARGEVSHHLHENQEHLLPPARSMTFVKAEDGNSLIARDTASYRTYRVRLALIEAPSPGVVWAAQSKYALYTMLRNAPDITVQEYSSGNSETIVGVVVDHAGRNINRAMVEYGAARAAAVSPADDELVRAMHTTLSAAEQQAKQSGLGLWSVAGRENVNWEFRVN